MPGGVFGRQHGAQGKAPAVLRVVGDGDAVRLRVVTDAVDARHLAFADGRDAQNVLLIFFLVGRGQFPAGLAVEVLQDAFRQGDGSAARRV